MLTTGEYVRNALIAAGEAGCCISDLHRLRKANYEYYGLKEPKGTYNSFAIFFSIFIRLKWVEKTGEVEPSSSKGNEHGLIASRTYYRITDEGREHSEHEWSNPAG